MTDASGEVSQHLEYFAFGGTFIEESNAKYNSPYRFNGKELDAETNLYYYGARYYDPKVSTWLSVDAPLINGHYLDGNHDGGVYNTFNLGAYAYCRQNPINYFDPDGNQVWHEKIGSKVFTHELKEVRVDKYTYVYGGDGYKRHYAGSRTENRLKSNYKNYNEWTGSAEQEATVYFKGAKAPMVIGPRDVSKNQRSTLISSIDAGLKAYNGDVVRGYENNTLSNVLSDIGVPTGVIATLSESQGANILAYAIAGHEIMTELAISAEKDQYKNSVGKVGTTLVNEAIGRVIENKYGKEARVVYDTTIAKAVEEAVK